MKKTVAFLAAVTMALCSFAACTDNKTTSSSESSSEVSAPAVHEIAVPFDREKAEPLVKEAITNYFNDINNGDFKASMTYQYDEEMMPAAAVLSGLASKGDTPEKAVENMLEAFESTYKGHTLKLNEIVSVESIPEEGYVLLDEAYGRLAEMNKLIEKSGDSIDPDHLSEVYQALTDFSAYRREYEEGYDVVASISVDDETNDQEMLVYRTVGGNWQIDMTVPTYMQENEQVQLDNTASSTAGSASRVLKKMKEDGKDISGTFIISKDGSKDYKVPSGFDMSTFRSLYEEQYKGEADADYFIVIDNEIAVYSVYETAEKKIGIYPFGLTIKMDGDKVSYEELDADSKYTMDQLYDKCLKVLG